MTSNGSEFSERYSAEAVAGSDKTDQPLFLQRSLNNEREEMFRSYVDETYDAENSLFKYPGRKFIRFRSDKIKFTFAPADVAYTSRRFVFYCTLRFSGSYWSITRDTFPANAKRAIYKNFFSKRRTDDYIIGAIGEIYDALVQWSKDDEEYRKRKYERFRAGEDIILSTVDEELFLTEEEIREIHEKRERILRRMIPPPGSLLAEYPNIIF